MGDATPKVHPKWTKAPKELRLAAVAAVLAQKSVPEGDPCAGLTPCQTAVLRSIGAGLSNAETAVLLDVSEQTIKNHLTGAYRKLGINGHDAKRKAGRAGYLLGWADARIDLRPKSLLDWDRLWGHRNLPTGSVLSRRRVPSGGGFSLRKLYSVARTRA